MTKHHLRKRDEGWRVGMVINGIGATLSFLVLVIVATVKFTAGAWVVMVLVPVMVVGLVRLNKAYEHEDVELREGAQAAAARTPMMTRHAIVVLVDSLDAAVARAMQYARTLTPDDLRAVHFDIDGWKTEQLVDSWGRLGLSRFPLDIVECPDRRVPRAARQMAEELVDDGRTELSILVPRRGYGKRWHRLLHDRSSAAIVAAFDGLEHCSVTIVPYQLGGDSRKHRVPGSDPTAAESGDACDVGPVETGARNRRRDSAAPQLDVSVLPVARTRVGDLAPRTRATVAGRVHSVRVQPRNGTPTLECTLADDSGSILVVFYGRRSLAGVRPGTVMSVEGVAGDHHGVRAILNPAYTLIAAASVAKAPQDH